MTRAEQLMSAVRQAQFPHADSLIHLFVGGSELHGAKVKNTDDLDIYGVYLEPPELVLGLDKQDFYVWSTAGDERRNGPDDIDVCLYSLRKLGGSRGKGQSDRPAFPVFAKLCTTAGTVGGDSEAPECVSLPPSIHSIPWFR